MTIEKSNHDTVYVVQCLCCYISLCTTTIDYVILSTVGQSIASISDIREHIYLALCALVRKYGASVVYIDYGLPHTVLDMLQTYVV